MSVRPRNRFVYATLRDDRGFNPMNPEVLLELGTENPIDWDAIDAKGVICQRLDFVLTVDHLRIGGVPLGIRCFYDHLERDFGLHQGLYVYVLSLRPLIDMPGRDSYQDALETLVEESLNVRRRNWCTDIGEIRVSWLHAPENVIRLRNGAFVPEETGIEPRPTEEEAQRMCDALDAWDPEAAQASVPEPTRDEVDVDLELEEPMPIPIVRLRLVPRSA